MSNLSQIAITAALSKDWQKAISANESLVKENKNDINTLNRLAHAYTQIGKLEQAKKLYKKILNIDKYNIIALKNLDKLTTFVKSSKHILGYKTTSYSLSPSLFIEEPGKTKTVSLRNTAPAAILSHLNPGDKVMLFPKKHSIDIRTLNKVYIGTLPDDFAFRLLRFLKAGYDYETYVKNASKNTVTIFIREVKRAKKFISQPSFLTTTAKTKISQTTKEQVAEDENQDGETNENQEDLEE